MSALSAHARGHAREADLPDIRDRSPVDAWQRYDADEQRLTAHVSKRMMELAGLRPWSRVLDVATGRGEPAIRTAARVLPDGWVVGTDSSQEMLELARARAHREAIRNLTLIAADAQTLEGVPEQAFDVALCRWGFMYFDQPVAGLKAVHSHLIPRGVLVSAVWTEPETASWWTFPRRVLSRHSAQPSTHSTAAGPFRYARTEDFRRDLVAAGFIFDFEELLSTALMEAASPDALIEWCLTFGLADALREQPESVQTAWLHDMMSEAEQFREPDGMYRLGGVTRLVVARGA